MKKRLISLTDELDELLVEFAKELGFSVNTIIVQQLWKLKTK